LNFLQPLLQLFHDLGVLHHDPLAIGLLQLQAPLDQPVEQALGELGLVHPIAGVVTPIEENVLLELRQRDGFPVDDGNDTMSRVVIGPG